MLDVFLTRIAGLSGQVRVSLESVGTMDKESLGAAAEVERLQTEYLDAAKQRSQTKSLGLDILSQAKKSRVALARIEDCRDTVTQKADEKISVVTDVYTLVDEHIQFLDERLKVVEGQLKEAGLCDSLTSKTGDKQAEATNVLLEQDAPVDPNEPVYCTCHRVAFGGMIGCDNDDCEVEWFHFACVGLTEQPTGAWYCADCKAKMEPKQKKRRRRR